MPRRPTTLLVALALLILLGASAFLIKRNHLRSGIAQAETTLADLRRQNSELRAAARNAPEAPDGASPAVAPAEAARQAADLLQGGLLGDLAWPPLRDVPDSISKFAGMLALREPDATALRVAVDTGIRNYEAAVGASAGVRRDGNTWIIEIPDRTLVRAAFEHMQQSIEAILGPERAAYYDSLGAKKAVLDAFDRWGMDGRILKVSREAPRGNGTPGGINFSRVYPAALTGAGGGGGASVADRNALRANVGPLESLLPPDF